MRGVIIGLSWLALASCGGTAVVRGEPHAEARLDAAVELAARLPRGAHRCAVARPGALSAMQRVLYVRLSKGEPLAFLPDAPFVAVASASRTDVRGRRERLTLIRTSADRRTVRRYLDERGGLRLSWAEEAEEGDVPGLLPRSARFLDERTLALGPSFEESARIGAEARCLGLASRHPDAIEVASWRGELGHLGELDGQVPRRVDYRAMADEHRLSMVRTSTMGDEAELGRRLFPRGPDGPRFGMLPLRVLAESTEERVEGRRVIEATRVSWEDLALGAADERRINAAVAEDARRRGPQPAGRVDVSNIEVVRRQRQLWQALVDAPGPRGVRARGQLRVLLERAIATHPRVAELRAHLFILLARRVGDAGAAAEVASAAIADGVGDVATFEQLRREAYARGDAVALAEALRRDGIVPPREARNAAEAIASAVHEGGDYVFAEGAWIAGRALVRRAYRARAHRVRPVPLHLGALIEALGVLVEIADGSGALWVAVEGDRRPWGIQSFDVGEAPRLVLDVGRDLLIGAATTGRDPRLLALGRSIADSLSPGPIVVSFMVVPFEGDVARPLAWGRLEGDLADDRLTIERIAGPVAAVDWSRVRRYLIEPLASSLGRVFPAPEVTIETTSTADAEALVAVSDLHAFVICRRRGLSVTCRGAPEREGVVRDFIIEFAGEVLVPAATAMTRRGR